MADPLHSINGVAPTKLLADQEMFEVQGSGKAKHTIKRTGDHYICSCPAWRMQKGKLPNQRTCKHLQSVFSKEYEEARLKHYDDIHDPRPPEKKVTLKPDSDSTSKARSKIASAANRSSKKRQNVQIDQSTTDKMDIEVFIPVPVSAVNDGQGDEDDPVWNINGVEPLIKLKDQEFVEVEGSGSSKYKVKRTGDHYSCTCPAWAFQKNVNIDCRSCKHCKLILGDNYERSRLEARGIEVKSAPSTKGKRKTSGNDSPSKKKKKLNDDKEEEESIKVEVLLANKFDLDGNQDPTDWWISEKLDGLRCFWDGKSQLYSRLGNPFSAPDWFKDQLPKGTTLDGELWHSRGGFDIATSIVRSGASKRWNEIRFHVFDVPSEMHLEFEERIAFLEKIFQDSATVAAPLPVDEDDQSQTTYVTIGNGAINVSLEDKKAQQTPKKNVQGERRGVVDLVQHTKCVGKEHLIKTLKKVEQIGGEGLMLRKPKSKYEGRRSSTLLKVKTFYEADAEVIGYIAGKGKYAGMTGSLKCRMETGQEFQVGSGMNDDLRKNPPKIGAIINYRFQEITKGSVPRFPTFLGECIDKKKPKDYVFPSKGKGLKKHNDDDDE